MHNCKGPGHANLAVAEWAAGLEWTAGYEALRGGCRAAQRLLSTLTLLWALVPDAARHCRAGRAYSEPLGNRNQTAKRCNALALRQLITSRPDADICFHGERAGVKQAHWQLPLTRTMGFELLNAARTPGWRQPGRWARASRAWRCRRCFGMSIKPEP